MTCDHTSWRERDTQILLGRPNFVSAIVPTVVYLTHYLVLAICNPAAGVGGISRSAGFRSARLKSSTHRSAHRTLIMRVYTCSHLLVS
eukprot:scaffold28316_cov21-Prasinocladus_malaysianus.AAC.1